MISWYSNIQGYFVTVNGDVVHFCKTEYERDMFIAELKIRAAQQSVHSDAGRAESQRGEGQDAPRR